MSKVGRKQSPKLVKAPTNGNVIVLGHINFTTKLQLSLKSTYTNLPIQRPERNFRKLFVWQQGWEKTMRKLWHWAWVNQDDLLTLLLSTLCIEVFSIGEMFFIGISVQNASDQQLLLLLPETFSFFHCWKLSWISVAPRQKEDEPTVCRLQGFPVSVEIRQRKPV